MSLSHIHHHKKALACVVITAFIAAPLSVIALAREGAVSQERAAPSGAARSTAPPTDTLSREVVAPAETSPTADTPLITEELLPDALLLPPASYPTPPEPRNPAAAPPQPAPVNGDSTASDGEEHEPAAHEMPAPPPPDDTAATMTSADTTPPIIYTHVAPSLPTGTPTKFSHTGDVTVSLADGDNFGWSTAFSADGTLMAVGAYSDDDGGSGKGAVYLFEKQVSGWQQAHKFSDHTTLTGAGDRFTTEKTDVDLDNHDAFGATISLSADGTLLAVGANSDDDTGTDRGAVYLFEKQASGKWSRTLKISDNAGTAGLLDVDLTANDYFGSAVFLSADGTVLAVGANGDDGGGSQFVNKGAVYLFEKSGGSWAKTLEISDNTGGAGLLDINLDTFDNFGTGVSLSADGTVLAVGANGDDDGGAGGNRGAVYLFQKSSGAWRQTHKFSDHTTVTATATRFTTAVTDINLDNYDNFGIAVSLSADGTLLAAGAYADDDGGRNTGAVYLFQKQTDNKWTNTLKISDNTGGAGLVAVDLDTFDNFGRAVSLSADGTLLLVGAYRDDDGHSVIYANRGAVYAFSITPVPTNSATITAVDNESGTTMKWVKITGTVCGVSQFPGATDTAYTEGSAITITAQADHGKRICFRSQDSAGNIGYGVSAPLNIDATAPTLATSKTGTDNTATYKVFAIDTSPPLTGRTKNDVTAGNCTDSTATTATGWSDYTPGTDTGAAHDTNGRCVIITDAAGNSKAQHLADSDNSITAFSLNFSGNGDTDTYDAITHYIYEVFKAQPPNGRQAMGPFLTGGDNEQTVWNRLQASAAIRDFSGNSTTDQNDAIIHYIYEVFRAQPPNGREAMTPFLTGAGARDGAAVFTLLNGFAGR